jgi:hypothetical protein
MTAAADLDQEKRSVFLERIGAMLVMRGRGHFSARLIVVISALIGSPVAQAEPVHLLCRGEKSTTDYPRSGASSQTHHDKFKLTLVIDRSVGTVTVNEHNAKIVGYFGVTVNFQGERLIGSLSNISGDAVINIIFRKGDLTQVQHFRGTCEPD